MRPPSLQRKLFKGAFFTVYIGAATSLLVAFLASWLLFAWVNQLRAEAHQEKIVSLMLPVLDQAASQQSSENLAQLLEDWSQKLGFVLEPVTAEQPSLNRYQRQRLREGRPVLLTDSSQVLLPISNPSRLIQITLTQPIQHSLELTLHLLAEHPRLYQAPEQWAVNLAHQLNHSVRLLTPANETAELDRLKRLAPRHYRVVFDEQQQAYTGYLAVDQALWLAIGPIPLFKAFPVWLLSGLIFMTLGSLAISTWWLLRQMEARLFQLERVSAQLAAGNLKARLPVQQSDFIGSLARSFNYMAEQLQRLLRTQQEMIHAVSHELRTPVARIRFGLQMIEDLQPEEADPSISRQIDGIDQDIDELDTLIDEILTYARLGKDQTPLEFSIQPISEPLEKVLEDFRRTHPNLDFELLFRGSETRNQQAELEVRYFQRAVQNLIANAVRYADHRIWMTCTLDIDSIRIDVEDDGPGIPMSERKRIFMPFSRLDDSRTRSSGGYGLGLSIVQRITYWHRGSILVDTSPTLKGARFTLLFPRYQPTDAPPLTAPP